MTVYKYVTRYNPYIKLQNALCPWTVSAFQVSLKTVITIAVLTNKQIYKTYFRLYLSSFGKCKWGISNSLAVILMNYYKNQTSNLDLGVINEMGRIVGKKI